MKNLFLTALLCLCILSCKQDPDINQPPPALETAFNNPPEWSKEVVWYQIFVERFRNGDPTNDPTKTDIKGSYPGVVPEGWQVTPWTHDWYKPDSYWKELEGTKDFMGYPVQSFGQKAQLRRYGGDLQGVLDKLDYLDSLGITAVYFNPLNDAPSLHKYDPRHWRHIDRNFGPTPKEDVAMIAEEDPLDPATWKMTGADKMFVQVIDALHQRGIKVILDYSWNHTGHMFWAWQDVLENGKDSKYADWYWIKKFDDPATAENEFEYRGWAGVFDLPEIKETQAVDHSAKVEAFNGDIFDATAKQHIFNVTKRWLDPNGDGDPSDGVDGYRLDVAAEVPVDFWKDYRKFVRDINPDAYLLGEVWWEEWPDHLLDPEPFLRGDIFDAPMNYRWFRSARHFFNASPDPISVSAFVDSLKRYTSNLRPENNYAMMNLVSSHDVPRVATSLSNKNKYKYNSSPFGDENYDIGKPDEATMQTLKLLLAQQFTYIGAPHIWAGDEMGMWGADDPSPRKPLIWPDLEFEPEAVHPLGKERTPDEVRFNEELFRYYQQLIRIRKDHKALVKGDIDYVVVDDDKNVLAYSRSYLGKEVVAVFNNSVYESVVDLSVKQMDAYQELLNDLTVDKKEDGHISITLPPRTAAIITGKDD